jgi:hypothetical protein
MRYNSDESLDDFIRTKIQGINQSKYQIEPSADFTGRVMARVSLVERHHRWRGYFLAVCLSMAPLMAREVWFDIRGNYFSVSTWPMGHFIVGAYKFFLSPLALYTLLVLGVSASIRNTLKFRRSYNSSVRIA